MIKYDSVNELVTMAIALNKNISELVINQQAEELEKSTEELYETMHSSLQVMKQSVTEGLDPDLKSASGMSGGSAFKMKKYVDSGKSLCGNAFGMSIARALAVAELNSCMGRIVAAPTAGACGIIPAALLTMAEEKNIEEEKIVMSLFTASAIGIVIAHNASISGAEGGCQAECGSASAMAAAALVELAGGTPEMVAHACAIALKNILGLVCDPVAGLVEVPCNKRNAAGVANAFVAAEMVLAGIESAIPCDEVILAMKKVGDLMSYSLKETAEGGLAATPTAKRISQRIY
ncbi:MAG: L-serine ammonia-lyase, iron-sulfur-dependent, subunit alpha [Firmicutes bacterium HGW-Firmicutes-7]|nr:MAG: L-serine ammonia-lyase, iron-sulfur-dependent, subunit alpha [Firmicutes bacterium HGW-Firmicutes-7]